MVSTRVINDPASLQRLGMLLESMDGRRDHLERVAQAHRTAGNVADAYDAQMAANHAAWVAYRVRGYMATISGLTVDDVEPVAAQAVGLADACTVGPPRTLVGLTDWLVALLGRWFPALPREGWQTLACVLHSFGRSS